jgi:two-component system chemotaxis response regulator CheB
MPKTRTTRDRDFPLICVGGSAGGLDAYIRLLQNLPADLGIAVVIVNHLRHTTTLLHEILPRYTSMPVTLITDRLPIQPNGVFIIPPQRDLHVLDGEFRLQPISKPRGWPDVITVLLRSMAEHWQGNLIAVIVSGFDGDGADALCEIRDVGGVTIAQQLDTTGRHPRDNSRDNAGEGVTTAPSLTTTTTRAFAPPPALRLAAANQIGTIRKSCRTDQRNSHASMVRLRCRRHDHIALLRHRKSLGFANPHRPGKTQWPRTWRRDDEPTPSTYCVGVASEI